jgi:hypothetical protein
VVSLELGYLTFCFFTSSSVAFLDLSNELIALSFDDLPVIGGQSSPSLLCLSGELYPASFDLVRVHPQPPAKLIVLLKQREKVGVSLCGMRGVAAHRNSGCEPVLAGRSAPQCGKEMVGMNRDKECTFFVSHDTGVARG